MTTTLLLIRHGATAANVSQPYTLQGLLPDSELIDLGVSQAKATAIFLFPYRIAHLYCSPLRRALSTAQVIGQRLGIPPQVVPEFVEADVGVWAGLAWDEVKKQWPSEYLAFHEGSEQNGYLGGENFTEVRDRVLPILQQLILAHEGSTIGIVGHGVVNRVLLAHWLGLPLRHARQLPQDNGGVSIVQFTHQIAKVRTVNLVVP